MSSSASVPSGSRKSGRKNAPGKRTDLGWEHGIDVENNARVIKCKYCEKVYTGGVFRFKNHLAGNHSNVEPCLQVPDEVKHKFIEPLTVAAQVSRRKRSWNDVGDDSGGENEDRSSKKQKGKGTVEGYFEKSAKQSTINQMFKKDMREECCQQISRFFYTSAIPFNCVKNPEFAKMLEMVGRYGIGLKPPSYHEVREKFLKTEVIRTMKMLDEYKREWKNTGCTVMSDGWTDRKRRSICNFLVNSPKGTVFLSSVDTSDISKTAEKVFDMLDEVIEKVGEENVVQVVTDNAANYKAAGEKLMEKRKRLYWTPCAAHCIDLMLEDFEKKIEVHQVTIAKGRKITVFIYARTMLISWLREFTKGRDLVRPAATRFATAYVTLGCLNEHKGALMNMFSSRKWRSSRFAGTKQGKEMEAIVLDNQFWKDIITCLKAAYPLVKVLRMVDSDKPAMGFIYGQMEQAKEKIRSNFKDVRRSYEQVWSIIDARWGFQLHKPLHAAAYFLNPQFHYSPNFNSDANIKIGLYNCLQRLVPDATERVKIDLQMDTFRHAKGLFGIESAVLAREKKDPADWWDSYGDECPELKRFAIRILSLTCSSSGCERNWSAFEMVHSKRRNRLHQKKMNDLVFVMYNLKLKEREGKRNMDSKEISYFEDIPSDDEWITDQVIPSQQDPFQEEQVPMPPQNRRLLEILDRSIDGDSWMSDDSEGEDQVPIPPCGDEFESYGIEDNARSGGGIHPYGSRNVDIGDCSFDHVDLTECGDKDIDKSVENDNVGNDDNLDVQDCATVDGETNANDLF